MTKTILEQKKSEIKHLDTATQAIIHKIDRNDRQLRIWAFATLVILMVIGLFGIYKQTQIASRNQQHIDCIVKLFTTPLPTDARSRSISNASSTCDIKFSQ